MINDDPILTLTKGDILSANEMGESSIAIVREKIQRVYKMVSSSSISIYINERNRRQKRCM